MTARTPKSPSGRGGPAGEAAPGGHVPPPGVAFVGHTPTPWQAIEQKGEHFIHVTVHGADPVNPICVMDHETLGLDRADAALIVRAVNAHAALVEALEEAARALWCVKVASDAPAAARRDAKAWLDKHDSMLKLARGES